MIRIGRRGRRSTQAPAGSVNRMNGRNSIVPSIANANGSTFRMMAAVRGMASRLICDPKTLIDWAAQSFWKSRLRIRRMTIMSLAASKPGAGVRDAGTCPLVGVRSHRGGGLEARLASRGREWDHRPVVGPGLAPGRSPGPERGRVSRRDERVDERIGDRVEILLGIAAPAQVGAVVRLAERAEDRERLAAGRSVHPQRAEREVLHRAGEVQNLADLDRVERRPVADRAERDPEIRSCGHVRPVGVDSCRRRYEAPMLTVLNDPAAGRSDSTGSDRARQLRPTSRETGDGLRERCWPGARKERESGRSRDPHGRRALGRR